MAKTRQPSRNARLIREALEECRLCDVRDACESDPRALIAEIRGFDPTLQEWFGFTMFPEGEDPFWPFDTPRGDPGWLWQAEIIEWFHDPAISKYLILKARQLGITWVACAYALWLMLYRPGAAVVAYSYTEDQAKKLVGRTWLMFQGLPASLRSHVEVIRPSRTDYPSEWIELRHADGRSSTFQALPATKKAGHGDTITFGIMDEVARQEYARDIFTAINPATSRGGKLVLISTANGVSNKETGEGNFFHHLYATLKERKIAFKFLPWNLHPERDQEWYEREALVLDEVERNQQYPLNENDAFMLSGSLYFDRDALAFYRQEVAKPLFSGQFTSLARRKARFTNLRDGVIEVYELPRFDGKYAISADCATGRGSDYTSCDVIDLSSGAIVASMHGKMEASRTAFQLHYLGKWFNTAKIAVERQGGYGDALIIALRDGNDNLPVYQNLYRHTKFTSGNKPQSEDYGLPMGANRGQILDGLQSAIRERLFPWLSAGHNDELGAFVYEATPPSPRAMNGCNDDRVLSLAIAVEMFRQFGQHPAKRRAWKKAKYRPAPTRQSQ